MSDDNTNDICAVNVLIESRGECANLIAFPANIVGNKASPAARPSPKIAAAIIDFLESGRTTLLKCCEGVKPRAVDVNLVCEEIEDIVPCIIKVIVGTPCNARIKLAVSQQNPVPPSASRIIGTSKNTAVKPYTTVGIALIRVNTAIKNLAMNFGARPLSTQQHPREKLKPINNDEIANRIDA